MSRCYLCSTKRSTDISLHKFPAHEPTRSTWFKFCDFTELDDVKSVKLCCRHFEENSFVHPASIRNGPRRVHAPTLKRLAVPTVRFPPRLKHKKKSASVSADNKVSSSHQVEVLVLKEEKLDLEFEETSVVNLTSTLDGIRNVTEISNHNAVPTIRYQPPLKDTQRSTSASEEHVVSSSHQAEVPAQHEEKFVPRNTSDSMTSAVSTPSKQKRKYFHPRFVSEITYSDVDTPNKAKQIVKMVKLVDEKKTKKIASLQQQQRRLKKRILELEQVIRQFTQVENVAEW